MSLVRKIRWSQPFKDLGKRPLGEGAEGSKALK